MHKLVYLLSLGAVGTLARYGLAVGVGRVFPGGFPWGTLAVNMLGCFLFGLVLTLGRERGALSRESVEILTVGFMGAFTTFSSFVNDTVGLARAEELGAAVANILVQNGGGVLCFFAGAALARLG
jgi:CrcB protein